MPANNNNCLSSEELEKFKNKYVLIYDKSSNIIVTTLTTCKRKTYHDADHPFHINAKQFNRKICFNMTCINIWKELQDDKKTKDITLFDVQNNANILKSMYQPISKKSIVELYRKKFDGIKKI